MNPNLAFAPPKGALLTTGQPTDANTPPSTEQQMSQILAMNQILAAASMFQKQQQQAAIAQSGSPPVAVPAPQHGHFALSPFANPSFSPYSYPGDYHKAYVPRLANVNVGPISQTAFSQNRVQPPYGQSPDDPKPAHSYIGLIAKAILSSPERKMVLADIYQHILDNYPYFRNRGPGWRNSIRHNLSLNDCFMKAGRCASGKGHYWAIHPANLEDFIKGDFRRRKAQRKVRRHMGLSVPDDDEDDDDDDDAPNQMISSRPLVAPHPLPVAPSNPTDPATMQLLAMSQMQFLNSLRASLPLTGPTGPLPLQTPPIPLTANAVPQTHNLFQEHFYKQLINLNLKHQHLAQIVGNGDKSVTDLAPNGSDSLSKTPSCLVSPPSNDSPPPATKKTEFSIEALLSKPITSRTPSPTAKSQSPVLTDLTAAASPISLQ